MEHASDAMSGWIVNDANAWWFVGVWLVVALGYALWRSRGDADPDPIRPSGPIE